MSLSLFDHRSQKIKLFVPLDKKRIKFYACGPTVYNYAHVGNARSAIIFDLLYRILSQQFLKENVVYVRNITDIDDKIISKALQESKSTKEIAKKYADIYIEQLSKLYALTPDHMPRATDYLNEMEKLINRLIAKKYAYISHGHVLFDTQAYKDYGKFSGFDKKDIQSGIRVKVAEYKRSPLDFVLWKPACGEEVGFKSKYGYGRPGWHLECSSMIHTILGDTIDIHGGGIDLKFPHHENENAQSYCAHNAPLANYWVHNGFVNMANEKMSKSLGNIVTIKDVLDKWSGETIRFALLSAHYRQPLEWSKKLLKQSQTQLDRFYRLFLKHKDILSQADKAKHKCKQTIEFLNILYNDLNTPKAISFLHNLREQLVNEQDVIKSKEMLRALIFCGKIIGIFNNDPHKWLSGELKPNSQKISVEEIEKLIIQRNQARNNKDYSKADEIRKALLDQDVSIEDSSEGTSWKWL